jgi:hypothetical protein
MKLGMKGSFDLYAKSVQRRSITTRLITNY